MSHAVTADRDKLEAKVGRALWNQRESAAFECIDANGPNTGRSWKKLEEAPLHETQRGRAGPRLCRCCVDVVLPRCP